MPTKEEGCIRKGTKKTDIQEVRQDIGLINYCGKKIIYGSRH